MRALPVFYFLLGILQVTAKETESNIFQVFLLAGQSNMQGRALWIWIIRNITTEERVLWYEL